MVYKNLFFLPFNHLINYSIQYNLQFLLIVFNYPIIIYKLNLLYFFY